MKATLLLTAILLTLTGCDIDKDQIRRKSDLPTTVMPATIVEKSAEEKNAQRRADAEVKRLDALTPAQRKAEAAKKIAQTKRDAELNSYNAMNAKVRDNQIMAEMLLQRGMRDPDSFKKVSWTKYTNKLDGVKISMVFSVWGLTYRAKNGFGGYNVEEQIFIFGENGVVPYNRR
jgi:hypothetical protein